MTMSGGTPTSSCGLRWRCRFVRTGRRAVEGLLALLFPPQCVRCGAPLDSLGVLCPTCERELPELSGPRCLRCGEALADPSIDLCLRCGTSERFVDRFFALGPYDGPWGELVRTLKFEREPAVGRFLARRMADWLRAHDLVDAFDWITYVPMSRRDRRARGFNQARLLAGGIGLRLHRPVVRALTKVRKTVPQSRLSAADRRANLRGAFRPVRYGNGRVLLVDDIGTTGSTVEACARALKRGGYATVVVLTVARA